MNKKRTNISSILVGENQFDDLEQLFKSIGNNTQILTSNELNEVIKNLDVNQIRDFSETPKFRETLEKAKSITIKKKYDDSEEDLAKHTLTKIEKIIKSLNKKLKRTQPSKILTEDLNHTHRVLSILSENAHRVKLYADLKR